MEDTFGNSFWEVAQRLQEKGILCDIQLWALNDEGSGSEAILAHKVILASSCRFFQNCLLTGELLDAYHFDGITRVNLQAVVDYVYHKVTWKDLLHNSEAALAAQTIQVIPHEHQQDHCQTAKKNQGKRPQVVFIKMDTDESKDTAEGESSEPEKELTDSQLSNSIMETDGQILSEVLNPGGQSGSEGESVKFGQKSEFEDHELTKCSPGDAKENLSDTSEATQKLGSLLKSVAAEHSNSPADSSSNCTQPEEVYDSHSKPLHLGLDSVSGHFVDEADCSNSAAFEKPGIISTDSGVTGVNTKETAANMETADGDSQLTGAMMEGCCGETTLAADQCDVRTVECRLPAVDNQECLSDTPRSIEHGQGSPEAQSHPVDKEINKNTVRSQNDKPAEVVRNVDLLAKPVPLNSESVESKSYPASISKTEQSVAASSVTQASISKAEQSVAASSVTQASISKTEQSVAASSVTQASISKTEQSVGASSVTQAFKTSKRKVADSGSPDLLPVRKTRSRSQPTVSPRTIRKEPAAIEDEEVPLPSPARVSRRQKNSVDYKLLLQGKDALVPADSRSRKNVETTSSVKVNVKTGLENKAGPCDLSNKVQASSVETPLKRKRGRPPKKRFTLKCVQDEHPSAVSGQQENVPSVSSVDHVTDRTGLGAESNKVTQCLIKQTACIDTSETKDQSLSTTAKTSNTQTEDSVKGKEKIDDAKNSVVASTHSDKSTVERVSEHLHRDISECVENKQTDVQSGNVGQRVKRVIKRGPNPCDHCRRDFKTQGALARHRRIIHKLKSEDKCDVCGMEFKNHRELQKHQRVEHQMALFSCRHCGASFKSQEGCKIHEYKKHSADEPQFGCEQCGKMFHLKAELKSHLIFRHSDIRPHACDQCDRAFKNKQMLQRHVSTYHSSVRNFQCDVCGSMFKTRPDCKAHREKHFREKNPLVQAFSKGKRFPDGQKYSCQFCDKVFKKRNQQLVHENLQHKQKNDGYSFLCTICSKVFAIKHYLMQHIRNCHSERRHLCPRCGQAFSQSSDLRKHMSVAGRCKGEPAEPKPYLCPHCGKGFSIKGNLAKHLQSPRRCRGSGKTPELIVVLQQTEGDLAIDMSEEAAAAAASAAASTSQCEDGTPHSQANDLQLATTLELEEVPPGVEMTNPVGEGGVPVALESIGIIQNEDGNLSVEVGDGEAGRVGEVAYLFEGVAVSSEEVLTGQEVMAGQEVIRMVSLEEVMQLSGTNLEIVETVEEDMTE